MPSRSLANGLIILAALGTAQGKPPETVPTSERDGLRLTISAEHIAWSSQEMQMPYSITNLGASPFHGCVLQRPEWKFYDLSGEDIDQVTVVDHVLCELEFSIRPGESASGTATARGPDVPPREVALVVDVLHLPVRLDARDHYVTTKIESARIPVKRPE